MTMKAKSLFAAALFGCALAANAALKPGDSISPYIIHNVDTGKEYCQVCAYGTKQAKIVAFGKLDDDKFWADLRELQSLQDKFENLGVFAQVIDSKDMNANKTAAVKHGIHFPVVVAVEKDWDKAYQVHGHSRTIYYARRNNEIAWTSRGLDDKKTETLKDMVAKDLRS
jgi:peroxiredoxin